MGTGKARTFYDLAAAVFTSLNVRRNIKFIEMPENLSKQYQYYTEANMEKFNTIIPNFKFSSLEDGVKDYVTNYLDREDQYLT